MLLYSSRFANAEKCVLKGRCLSGVSLRVCVRVYTELQMQYMSACMRDQWGGKSVEDCCRKMTKMATVLSGRY